MSTQIVGYDYSVTLAQVRATLQARLAHSADGFFTAGELDFYLNEALAVWNCYARYFRCVGKVDIAANARKVDLTQAYTVVGSDAPYITTFSTSLQKVLLSMGLTTLEKNTATNMGSSDLTGHISSAQFTDAIIYAVNQILMDSSHYAEEVQISPVVAEQNLVALDNTAINILRAEWETLDGVKTVLHRGNLLNRNNYYSVMRETTGVPEIYSIQSTPQLKLELSPIPSDNGKLNLVVVKNRSLSVDLFAADQAISFATDWWWLIKLFALRKIYSTDGPTKYPQMERYCETRISQAMELLRGWGYIENVYCNGVNIPLASVAGTDHYAANWRAATTASIPTQLNMIAANLGYINETKSEPLSLTFDQLRDAPTVSDDDDIFPIAPEHLNAVLDYAQHTASMKMGGSEFELTLPLYQNFLYTAARYNDKLKASLDRMEKSKKKLSEENKILQFDTREAAGRNG